MSQLCAQSIKHLCNFKVHVPMIQPFSDQKHVVNGKSWGLSAASYDIRIAHDLVLGPDPAKLLSRMMRSEPYADKAMEVFREAVTDLPPSFALAHSIEDFNIPNDVVGYVCDKSTYARVMVSAFNTLFDPGFRGNATLELVNLGDQIVEIKAGDPICQIAFHWLDAATDRPYNGKYQHQPKRPVPAIHE